MPPTTSARSAPSMPASPASSTGRTFRIRPRTAMPVSRDCRTQGYGRFSPMARARTRTAGSWRLQPPNIPATSGGCASSISPATINSSRSISQHLAARRKRPFRSSRPRATWAPASPSMSGSASSAQRAAGKAQCRERPQGRHHLHPLLHAQRHRMEAHQGYRRHDSIAGYVET